MMGQPQANFFYVIGITFLYFLFPFLRKHSSTRYTSVKSTFSHGHVKKLVFAAKTIIDPSREVIMVTDVDNFE